MVEKLEKFGRVFCLVLMASFMTLANVGCSHLKPDLAKKPKMSDVVKRLKGAKILSVQDYDKINPLDQFGWSVTMAEEPSDYDRNYPKRLKEYLGIDIKIVRLKELNQEIDKVTEKEAGKMADVWINEATEVRRGVKRKDIMRAAKLYLGLNELYEKYDAQAVTLASWYLFRKQKKLNAVPAMAWLEFSKKHVPGSCQCHIDCLATMLIGKYITGGYSGFDGDILNDWSFEPIGDRPKNVVIIAHCGAPITPHGNDRIPYEIRDHIVGVNRDKDGRHTGWAKHIPPEDTLVAPTVTWPTDEAVSVIKFDVYRKKVSIHTGTILDGNALYRNFRDEICRNKMVIQIDDPEHSYLLPSRPGDEVFRGNKWFGSWGCHQVVFYGNLRKEIKEFAALTGFEVVE